ncbi:hypothetical protein M3O96_20430 [Aquiflexum sp. TKW24L]|uniref:hypothetical protein n=1 Tax=Aquiflexum sp. TKW24L TaxID=2942212 RepID=UPI0020C05E11|nr:hypothetical protein [Aquiflexum sp. TKW24L]MCL6261478.1 hypothetical protein [Aquiflexum sp. TKW24L]
MRWSIKTNQNPDYSKGPSMRMMNWLSGIILFFGIIIVLFFGVNSTGKAIIFIWMLACLLFGAAIGFLFGIPKILQNNQTPLPNGSNSTPAYQQQVNTNLTEISDWLTKIIVGLGLVNLINLPPYLSKVANVFAKGLSMPSGPTMDFSLAFAYGTIISYTILGFLFGYITTRLYLAGAFSEADQRALRIIAQKTEDAAGAAKSALQKAEFAMLKPSTLSHESNEIPEEQMNELSISYDNIRSSWEPGKMRTTKMAEIVKEMMALSNSLPTFDVSKALKETDNGKRLAGYAYLYVKPEYKYIEELVNAFTLDPTPFGQYWGIQALEKVLDLMPTQKLSPTIFNKLKTYYDKLAKGNDREYELRRLFPEIKK